MEMWMDWAEILDKVGVSKATAVYTNIQRRLKTELLILNVDMDQDVETFWVVIVSSVILKEFRNSIWIIMSGMHKEELDFVDTELRVDSYQIAYFTIIIRIFRCSWGEAIHQ